MGYRVSDLALAEIDALKAEGVDLTPQDILRINALALRVESPSSLLHLSRGVPVACGGVWLWPMTIASGNWFQEIGGNLKGTAMQTYALAYAMAYGRDEQALDYDIKSAERKVKQFAKGLRCRSAELVEAIKQVIAQDEIAEADKSNAKPKHTLPELASTLAAMTHTDPRIWEYQCSIGYVCNMLNTIVRQNSATGEATISDSRIRAERQLGLAIARIRRRHNGE